MAKKVAGAPLCAVNKLPAIKASEWAPIIPATKQAKTTKVGALR